QPFRERHDCAVHPSLAGQASGAGRAGHGLARASAGGAGRRGDGPGPARPWRRHDPERRQYRARCVAPSRCSASADSFDRCAPPGGSFSAAPAVGYGRAMTDRADSRPSALRTTTIIGIGFAAFLALVTMDALLMAAGAKTPIAIAQLTSPAGS